MIKAKAAWRWGIARMPNPGVWAHWATRMLVLAGLWALGPAALAQETICARVKIEIKQELTFERQGFEAEMKILNSTDSSLLENIRVDVKVTDEIGTPVPISTDPNDLNAKFFIRLAKKEHIAAVDGSGTVGPRTTARIEWLLIPAPGAAGSSPLGKKFLVGATLRYRYGGEDTELNVSPDVIKVKPLPLLTLDYFLPREVEADDPLTPEVEPVVPFTLGVRVRNNGLATASNLKIDSAQPKIVENKQGLLIGFKLTGSYINDAPVQNTLIANFGDVPGNSAKMGRWIMETTLSGKFTEFTARFSHADELGGAMTSLVQATRAHELVRDVRVDLPGRDAVRDFFARDGDVLRVYESDGPDTEVTEQSAQATLAPASGGNGYTLNFPVTAGFVYVRLKDPFEGQKPLDLVLRSDAKKLPAENAWLSRTRNAATKQWEYWVNFFDVNSTGSYTTGFKAPDAEPKPPVLQYIPDRTVKEGQQLSFLVEASSPNGRPVQLSAAPLPAGARLLPQAVDPLKPSIGRAVFDWTPPKGSQGSYTITYTAHDGLLQASRQAKIVVVQAVAQTKLPGTPRVVSPLSGERVSYSVVPMDPTDRSHVPLNASTSGLADDTATSLIFELYADESMAQQLAVSSVPVPSGAQQASWYVPLSLLRPNQKYWWRVRASDGLLFSPWVTAWFFANSGNNSPGTFNQAVPSHDMQVGSTTPALSWTHAEDADQEALRYTVELCRDRIGSEAIPAKNGTCNGAAGQVLVTVSPPMVASEGGSSGWTVQPPLTHGTRYYWRVTAWDASGTGTSTAQRTFTVNIANTPPPTPVLVVPDAGGLVDGTSVTLGAQGAIDPQGDPVSYQFEIDTAPTFDSAERRSSGTFAYSGSRVNWTVNGLVEGRRYWWRVKALDTRAESSWAVSSFVVSPRNFAPAVPVIRYPGQDAWVSSAQPSLGVSAIKPVGGRVMRYQFEVYADAALSQKVAEGSSDHPSWVVSKALSDLSTYWWRARAMDDQLAGSDWTSLQRVHVRLGSVQGQSVALTWPDRPVAPSAVAGAQKRVVALRWEVVDPASDPKVALYYKSVALPQPADADPRSTFNGSLIVEGLRPMAGQTSGVYEWDVSSLPTGTYYVYAVVLSNSGEGRSFAPGAVVVPPAMPQGTMLLMGPPVTNEGGTASYGLQLKAPLNAPVTLIAASQDRDLVGVPRSRPVGTSSNGIFPLHLARQCFNDLPATPMVLTLVSEDPNWHGRVSNVFSFRVSYAASNAGTEEFRLCKTQVLLETPVSDTESDYLLTADLVNLGPGFAAATVVPVSGRAGADESSCPVFTAVQGELRFGAVGTKEIGHAAGSVLVRAGRGLARAVQRCGPLWQVKATR